MTELETRILRELGSEWNPDRSAWEGLLKLYQASRESFYLLACDGFSGGDETIRALADHAQRVRAAVRSTYRIEQQGSDGAAIIKPCSGDALFVPASLFDRVKTFLLEIDGKTRGDKYGKDYEGRPVSEAEVRFKLGDGTAGEREQERAQARREAKPVEFRVREEDLRTLGRLPPYVTYGLTRCAKKTLLAPTSVYRGLNRGSEAPPRLQDGWAVCGKPSRAYDNEGRSEPAPAGMLYMVFADQNGVVFDWDWVREDDAAPGHPLNMELRFHNPVQETRELVLDLPEYLAPGQFDASKPVLSRTGDCVFCYMTDAPSFGERINEDLTVFYSLANRETITGFKIKNVGRILREQQVLKFAEAPGLNVLILPILRDARPTHLDVTIKLYELIITAMVHAKVPLPAPDDCDVAAATC